MQPLIMGAHAEILCGDGELCWSWANASITHHVAGGGVSRTVPARVRPK
jgi:hypothetical protein